jgi:hypothetical protein
MRQAETVRRRFLLMAAAVLAAAILIGQPKKGWMQEDRVDEFAATSAFHLAAAATQRGVWEFEQGHVSTKLLSTGRPIPRLNNDYLYTDVPGGTYRVKANYNPRSSEWVVLGTGIDAQTGYRRTLRVVYRRQAGDEGLNQIQWQEVAPQ